ncbi:MAG TPA: PilZ domain-containing protein [Pyrinomonadaceae bacterium]|nr:PilZ domain-containing protein [Pyrinomonadaceae bacterium]
MPRQLTIENRSGPRYLAALEVRAEWDGDDGTHYVAEGTTENVGPEGALIHLQRELPNVGSRVQLRVLSEEGEKLSVVTEVLRLERNPAHPLAALQLINGSDEWRGLVWEPARPQITLKDDDDEEDGDEEEIEETTH